MRKEEGLFELVLNSVPVRVFWKDLNLNFIGCNKSFAEDAGFSDPSDLIGKSDYDMGWKDQADLYRNDDREVIETGIPKLNYEEPQTTPDGERILLRTSKMPLRDEDGVIIGVLGTYEDITWQRITEDTLLETQESYTDIFNTVTDAIYIQDLDGRFLDLNRGALDLYGYPKDEIVGNAPEFLGAPGKNNYDALSKMLTRVHKTGKPARFEFWGKRKDGTVFPKEVLVNRGKHFGKPVLIATARDITQTKAASAALRSSTGNTAARPTAPSATSSASARATAARRSSRLGASAAAASSASTSASRSFIASTSASSDACSGVGATG
ncbi:MAG: PAS domain-containing protein, partial [Bacteroidales bacterium]